MFRKLQRMSENPVLAVQYLLHNPRKVAVAILGLALVVVLLVLSFGLGFLPNWLAILGLAVVSAYVALRQYGRVEMLVSASKVDAGSVTAGVVKVSGTARAVHPDDGVSPESDDGTYLAYRYREKVEDDPGSEPALKRVAQDETAAVPFYVEDDTGSVLVDADNADIRLAWDDKTRGARKTTYWATLDDGDSVHVYGTAMAPAKRSPPGSIGSMSDLVDSGRDIEFEDDTDEEDVILTKSEENPYLVISDRAGLSLLGRQVMYLLGAILATLALVGISLAAMAGILSL